MPEPESVVHEEITTWAPWVAVLVWGSALLGAFMTVRALSRPLDAGVPWGAIAGLAPLVLLPFALQLLFGRLRLRVTRNALHLGFGYGPLIKRTVTLEDVRSMEPVRYSPKMEFGGWGIRTALRGRKRAWTQRGDRALGSRSRTVCGCTWARPIRNVWRRE